SMAPPKQQRWQNAYDQDHTDRDLGQTLRDYLLVPRVLLQWFFPVIIVIAIYLFMRGHDLPGGGFVAGVTMSIAFILQYMGFGTRWTEARLLIQPINWIGLGLLIAVVTG